MLRDWKKRKSLEYPSWFNQKRYAYLNCYKSSNYSGWIVTLQDKKISPVFKTKSQALKFAKDYMRKH